MVLDPRKRQKKLEKKAAKRKAQLKALAQRNPTDLRSRLERAAEAPVLHSQASDSLWSEGIGYVLLSRAIGSSQIAFSAFLVDMYCLGVKDAMCDIRSRGEIEALAENMMREHKIVKFKPECIRNLVEGAVEYARNLGFEAHEDYQRARLIFGDIDGSACTEKFVYGDDGQPHFVAGPYESSSDCREIVNSLNAHVGPQGYRFSIPGMEDELPLETIEMADEDWDEDD